MSAPMDPFFPSEKAEPINFKYTLYQYLRYWYLFVIGVCVSMGMAFLYLRYATPEYYINSSLLIKDSKSGSDLSGNAVFSDLNLFDATKSIDNEIVLLKSASLMQRVLSELGMQTSYYVQGNVKDVEVYAHHLPIKLIFNKVDSTAFNRRITLHFKDNATFDLEEGESITSHKYGQEIQKPYGTFTVVASPNQLLDESHKPIIIQFHDIRKLAIAYSSKLNVTPINKQASALYLAITDPVREKGKDILDKLVEVYKKEAVEDKNLTAANTLDFIDERLKYLSTELSTVEKNVEQFKRQNEVTDVSAQVTIYLDEASGNNKQLADWDIQIEVLESIEKYVAKPSNEQKLVPSALSVQDATLSGLISRFNELQLERERMLRVTQTDNPLVKNLNEQLINLRENILENLRNVKNSLIITRRNLQAKSGQFGAKIKNVPTIERELLEISRQQEIKQALYLYLLQKREESALSLAATVSNSRIIDPATPGDYPISPNKMNIYLVAFLLGMGLPFAGIYLKNLLNDKVQTKVDVERATATPILGEITHNNSGETLVVTEKSRTPIAELFRLIRSNMQFTTLGRDNRVVLVTSSMSGEGKTFFSFNLGATLAQTGKKAVVLEFDLRRPQLLQGLHLSNEKGISNYLSSEKVAIDDIVQPSGVISGLFVVGSGLIPPNPAAFMLSPKIGQLFSLLKENFDYIIIDTAPVGQVADAFSLAPYVDSTIFLIRYNYTLKAQISIIKGIFDHRKLNYPMIVLNDAKKQNHGYGYGYGYGYREEKKKGLFQNISGN